MSATLEAPKRLTPDDLLRMPDGGAGYELVDGELKELAMSTESNRIAGEVFFHLRRHTGAAQPGWVFPQDTPFCCFPDDPDRVRKPDVAFVSLGRMPVETYQDDGYCQAVPDLVAEVLSPNDYAKEVARKRDEWLAAGVRTVWIVEPETRSIHVHRADGSSAFLRAADTLTAPDVLPGFAVPVADLFRLPGQPVS